MSLGFLVFRRDLPGGRFVMVTVEEVGNEVIGRLQFERRTDRGRQRTGMPPVIAEARGATRDEVLAQLKRLAENDEALSSALEDWSARRRPA
jgi:hypothetical protein